MAFIGELWADMADVQGGGSGGRGRDGGKGASEEERWEGEVGAARSSLSRDDPVTPKAPLQLQVLQLLPQLLPVLLLLLLTLAVRLVSGCEFIK